MEIFLITLAVSAITFLFDLIFRKAVESNPVIVGNYKIHHSVIGVLFFVSGIVLKNQIVLSIGLGAYLSHGLEEMYFDKTRFPKAFFILVTRK